MQQGTLWQHSNGTYYVLYGDRQRTRSSLRTKDRTTAQIRLGQWLATRDAVTPDDPSVAQILAGYAEDHGKTLRGKDGLKYARVALERHLGVLLPVHLTPNTSKQYAVARAREGVGPGTVLREIGVLRAALGWAVAHRWLGARPVLPDPVQRPRSRERWMDKAEAQRLLAACQTPHVRLFVMLGLMTGARTSAVLELPWSSVDLARRLIDFGEGHGNKRRAIVPVNDDLLVALQAAKVSASTPYVVEHHGKPVRAIKKGFAAACMRAGISGVTPHVLRHTAATWMVETGELSDEEIGRMIGDKAETVRKVYGHHSPNYLKRASSALQFSSSV